MIFHKCVYNVSLRALHACIMQYSQKGFKDVLGFMRAPSKSFSTFCLWSVAVAPGLWRLAGRRVITPTGFLMRT